MKHLAKVIRNKPPVTVDTPVERRIGTVFNRDGREWVVSVVGEKVIMGTATDAELVDGEPMRLEDIICVRTRAKQLNNKSGYNGVLYCPENKKFRASVQVNNVSKHLGYRNTLRAAKQLITDYEQGR